MEDTVTRIGDGPATPPERRKNKAGNYRGMSEGTQRTKIVDGKPVNKAPEAPPVVEPDVEVMLRIKGGSKARTVQEKVWAKLLDRDPIRFNAELERLQKSETSAERNFEWDGVSECPCCHRGPVRWEPTTQCPTCLREPDVVEPGPAWELYKKLLAEQFSA